MEYGVIVFLIVLLILALIIFNAKRKNRVKQEDFPEEWTRMLHEKVDFYAQLSTVEKLRFEKNITQFLKDVSITGIEVSITDLDKLYVASSAVIPLFGFPFWRYRNLNEVLLYKDTFNEEFATEEANRNVLGMVGSGAMNRMMILSKPALHQGFENKSNKSNVGIHEFVHLLDKADGETDGIPDVLLEKQYLIPWIKRMHTEIEDLKNENSDINPYGAKNEAEFLSVVSEYFFKQPELLEKKHPELFVILEKMYKQDLA